MTNPGQNLMFTFLLKFPFQYKKNTNECYFLWVQIPVFVKEN